MFARLPRLSKKKQDQILKCFVQGKIALITAEDVGVHRNSVNKYYRHYRELIMERTSKAPRFAGEVEMDQAFFGRGAKARTRERKAIDSGYGDWRPPRGLRRKIARRKKMNVMVFGIIRREGDVYTKIIEKANRDTLFPIIHLVVDPGTTIYTDQWAGFNELKISGYVHKAVNHSVRRRTVDGVHTHNIDRFWGYAKGYISRFKGVSRHVYPLYLKEAEFRYNHRKDDLLRIMRNLVTQNYLQGKGL